MIAKFDKMYIFLRRGSTKNVRMIIHLITTSLLLIIAKSAEALKQY